MRRTTILMHMALVTALLSLLPTRSVAGLILTPDLTAQDVNALVALEATQFDLVATAYSTHHPFSRGILGTWSGTIDAHGWDLSFAGRFNGTPLSIHQVGLLDLPNDQATWIDTGMYDSIAVGGSGSIEFDPFWKTFFKVVNVVTVGGIQVLSTAASGGTAGTLNALASPATAVIINGIIDDAFDARSSVRKPTNSTTSMLQSFAISSNQSPIFVAMVQTGTLDQVTSEAQFRATAVPEPDSIALPIMGLLFLAWFVRTRRRECLDDKKPRYLPWTGRGNGRMPELR